MSPTPQKRRPPNLNLSINTSTAATPPKPPLVPILKPRDPVPQTPPNRRAQTHTSRTRANPTAVSRAVKLPQPSSSHSQHADDRDSSLVPSTTTPAHRTSSTAPDPADLDVEEVPPVDMSNKENEYGPRDSHDLSMPHSQSTRDSLMASMLLSLDQLTSLGQTSSAHMTIYDDSSRGYSSYGAAMPPALSDDRTWTRTSRASRPNTSSRFGPSHGHSYSSDLEAGDDAARLNLNRSRRSNSNSTYQTSDPTRMNSLRGSIKSSQPSTPRRLHTRGGGKGSKSSSSNSIDAGYVQVLGSQRWASGFGGRSSSFDYGHRPVENTQPTWHTDFTHTFLNDDYDAAPTPTVPGGPRRTAPPTPVTATFMTTEPMPVPTPVPEPRTPTLERKRSTRSARSMTASGRKGESKFSTVREAIPPLPTFADLDLDSAPAPHVGYEKAKEAIPATGAVISPTAYVTTPQPKEKQGFFRRVFGSSRNTTPTSSTHDLSQSPAQFSSSSNLNGDHNGQPGGSQTRTNSTPSRDGSSNSPHVLQKKPSSFFRRRKKSSVHDSEAPPLPRPEDAPPLPTGPLVPPISLQPNLDKFSSGPEPSPVSSLRKVMSPYLRGSPTVAVTPLPAPEEQQSPPAEPRSHYAKDIEGYKRDFSPDYEPSPKAVIRTVDQKSSTSPDLSTSTSPRLDTPDRPPPDIPHSSDARNDSFLNLDPPSDNEFELAATPSARVKAAAKSKTTTPAATDTEDETDEGNGAETESDERMLAAEGHLLAPLRHKERRGDDTFKPIRRRIRAALDITDSEEEPNSATLALPIEGARSVSAQSDSAASGFRTSPSNTPSVRVELTPEESVARIAKTNGHLDSKQPIDEPDFVVGDPTDDDRQKAQKIFDGNEDFIQKDKAAAWMGAEGLVRQRTLRAYMDLYDFTDLSIIASLRQVCGRLVMRAETQQMDRILLAYSARWCECNANHGFKSIDVIHTICYSIMLLNTDLHMADIESKMTRSQFVKNTLTTIQQALEESSPEVYERPTILPGKAGMLAAEEVRPSTDQPRSSNRLSFLPPGRTDTNAPDAPTDDCGPLVKAPFDGPIKAWEGQIELVLKDIYASIRDERLPLFGAESDRYQTGPASQSSLSVMGMLKRTPSVLSKAPSESQSSLRGRIAESSRTNNSRWGSKSRSRHRLGNTGFSSSRTSFDDGNSIWSPAASSATWSRQSLGRTQTSMSMDSFGSAWPRNDYQQSIGFANALSQAIIREDIPGGGAPSIMSNDDKNGAPLLEDESLELAGPPWVKEGIVTHKHHLDGIDRKAKDRNWTEVFAVVQKGTLSLFSFSPNKSLRNKTRSSRHNKGMPIQVGGGNWQENATNLGTFSLRQTLASALPPPGYSRSRPHVWALSLPTGAVHLFQVGTPEIIKEFVTTANYWSARLSTHPLIGGISNIEYGWSEAIVNNSLVTAINESTTSVNHPGRISRPGSSATTGHGHGRKASVQSGRSYRSGSFDLGPMGGPGSGSRHKLPGDKIHIAEWVPPTQSLRASNQGEEEQLRTLEAYVRSIEEELQQHNQLRSPMLLAFSPRGHNAAKAMANWERKSAYLLREIVKYRTYVDCLQQADSRKKEIYGEREEREREREETTEIGVGAE
ncbi:hypothetical protein jhhlp_005743 [Lomentospora prolificans]|uniref:SEC7 domain-containing protein n=1 Tax=Lomentospora prolificans TaxID=41688 RepID=A0A2N3N3Y6_9PEZI|nr:hypothetical protein jhhlp_005743 [Lomentospora prolificans]